MLAIALALIDLIIVWFAGPGGLLLLITVLIAATLLVAPRFAAEHPARPQLAPAALARLWCGEVLAAWSVFLFWMPLERWCMARDRPGVRARGTPVLLIHGYVNNAGAMWRLWQALCRDGVAVHTLNLEPVYGGIDRFAPLIEARIRAIRAITGAAQVIVVCHSMGGLAARAYLRHCALNRLDPGVAKVVTLGTPHHGTVLARIEWSPNGRQMVPGNAWLTALAAHEQGAQGAPAAWACPLVSIYSLDDNIVTPPRSSHLEGARNIVLEGIGHISLPLSRRVIELVRAEVSDNPGEQA